MANTEIQNGQRGTIFLTFLVALFFCIINIINCVKKRIDPVQGGQESAEKYKDGQKKQGQDESGKKQKPPVRKQKVEEDSTANFDGAAIAMKAQQVEQDDPTIVKVAKKNEQFQLIYYPLFVMYCLNLVTGTTKAFSLINYLFTLIIVFLFNVLKVHKKCSNHICLNVVLDNLWLLMIFFEIINHWAATPVSQPYIVTGL